ncbi:MAG TPA: YiiD C-terminal domain-containing protein [Lysobacter sp.]|nr:YiiD C-terminal domain-containing protein [Lysobacter sp.]
MTALHDAALARLQHHFDAMPPVAALQLRVDGCDGRILRLSAPLALHVNDKGCAFGGSLASMMTLAGWGLLTLKLEDAGRAADVYVADSQLRYLAPLYDDLRVEAALAAPAAWPEFLATFDTRGRARIEVHARALCADGTVATESVARFAALRRADAVG